MLLAVLIRVPALAQLSAGASVGYGIPTETGGGVMWGGGLEAKYYFNYRLAVGASVRAYTETLGQTDGGLDGKMTAITMPIMATIEYHITDTDLHPYVGLEAGVIRSALITDLRFNGQNIYDDSSREYHPGLAPKLGVGFDITQGLMVKVEAMYNVGLGKNQAGNTTFNFEKSARFLTVHAGIAFTFGNRFD